MLGLAEQGRPLCRRLLAEQKRREAVGTLASDSVFRAANVLFRCRFHNELLGVTDEEGCVSVHSLRRPRDQGVVEAWRAHNNAIFDIGWLKGGRQVLTASADQSCALWDLERTGEALATFHGHSSSVRSLAVAPGDHNVFATGSRDGAVLVWDLRNRGRSTRSGSQARGPVQRIPAAHRSAAPGTPIAASPGRSKRRSSACDSCTTPNVTAVIFSADNCLLSASDKAAQGIRQWDLRYLGATRHDPVPAAVFGSLGSRSTKQRGFSSLCLDRSGTRLFAASTASVVFEFSLAHERTTPVRELHGASIQSFYVDVAAAPDGDFLLSGSSLGAACIWDVGQRLEDGPTTGVQWPLVRLEAHQAEVTGVAWGPGDAIVTCEDAFWRLWAPPSARGFPRGNEAAILGSAVVPTPPPEPPVLRTSSEVSRRTPPPPRRTPLAVRTPPQDAASTHRKRRRLPSSASPEKRRLTPRKPSAVFAAATPTNGLPNLVVGPDAHCHGPAATVASFSRLSLLTPNASEMVRVQTTSTGSVFTSPTKYLQPEPKRRRVTISIRDYFPKKSSSSSSGSDKT